CRHRTWTVDLDPPTWTPRLGRPTWDCELLRLGRRARLASFQISNVHAQCPCNVHAMSMPAMLRKIRSQLIPFKRIEYSYLIDLGTRKVTVLLYLPFKPAVWA